MNNSFDSGIIVNQEVTGPQSLKYAKWIENALKKNSILL